MPSGDNDTLPRAPDVPRGTTYVYLIQLLFLFCEPFRNHIKRANVPQGDSCPSGNVATECGCDAPDADADGVFNFFYF